ncbi:Uracil DNA glycosylase superfamily protein [Candidatus Electrothrix aarhusensis]|uniref:Uracil DNA glycosylase superfamily protein n=1 Tax=Candidatus Electrothrix aarhusensis TaxID=1859131 RepID=A0A3S3SN57_9BACT|nr:Uracil DNA glycosylase superfamily protein [Candidatus Electrothrix aarhusensis]
MSAQKKDPAPSSGRDTAGKTHPAVDPAALALLTGQVRNLLAFHQEMGLTGYPAAPELRQFLKRVPRRSSAPAMEEPFREQGRGQYSEQPPQQPAGAAHQAEKPTRSYRPPEQKGPQTTARPTAETVQQQLKALNQELTHCRCCTGNAASSVVHSNVPSNVVLGQGSPTPLLLVVGDCFIGTLSEKGQVWGKEEDAMLWRMMQAIGLDQRSVYVTNAIKCPQPGPVQLGSLMEKSCFPHLEKEIQIIRPQLICAMGDSVTRALLKTKAPLARLRGRFRSYRSPQGNVIKIMPTYHPRLLLQHPEMKQATWKDLQAVQRMLLASSHAV